VSGAILDPAPLDPALLDPALLDPALLDPVPEPAGAAVLSLEQAVTSSPAVSRAHITRGRLTRRE